MSMVLLASGGLDSTLSAVLAAEKDVVTYPLFVDYGQRSKRLELDACIRNYERLGLPTVNVVDVSGFGDLYKSSLINPDTDIVADAFLPGRNLLLLLMGATYACDIGATSISIGLLKEEFSWFPDQTRGFLNQAQEIISLMTRVDFQIVAPLMEFTKKDVVMLAKEKGVYDTYSCHTGEKTPCGSCIACREFEF